MSKVYKSELKEIIKECLIEILAEGLGSGSSNTLQESTRYKKTKKIERVKKQKKSYLDNISYNTSTNQNSNIQTNITKDPILNSILADTAKTTLREQATAGRGKSVPVSIAGDKAAKAVDKSNPETLFGKASNKWASLAFS